MRKTILYLLRHGQTVENATGMFQGQRDGTLSARGVWQAVGVRPSVSALPFEAVLCSDLGRTRRTASIVLGSQPDATATTDGRPIVYTPLLRERDMGRLTGRSIASAVAAGLVIGGQVLEPTTENTAQCSARARRLLDYIAESWQGRRLLVISHGHFLRVLMAVAAGKEVWQVEKMDNCDIREITID